MNSNYAFQYFEFLKLDNEILEKFHITNIQHNINLFKNPFIFSLDLYKSRTHFKGLEQTFLNYNPNIFSQLESGKNIFYNWNFLSKNIGLPYWWKDEFLNKICEHGVVKNRNIKIPKIINKINSLNNNKKLTYSFNSHNFIFITEENYKYEIKKNGLLITLAYTKNIYISHNLLSKIKEFIDFEYIFNNKDKPEYIQYINFDIYKIILENIWINIKKYFERLNQILFVNYYLCNNSSFIKYFNNDKKNIYSDIFNINNDNILELKDQYKEAIISNPSIFTYNYKKIYLSKLLLHSELKYNYFNNL